MAEQQADTAAADVSTADVFEYATYSPTPEVCPACGMPIPVGQLTRRGMLTPGDGPPVVAYWHPRCVRADGTRVGTP